MKFRYIVVSIAFLVLSSCSNHAKITIGDGGLLSSSRSCAPPCFLGISPGVTKESQAWDILRSQGIDQSCKNWDNTSESGTRGIQCEFSGGGPKGSLGVISLGLDTKSDMIRFVGFTPSEVITIQDIIKKYGSPNWIAVWDEGTPEHIAVDITIFYDNISTRLDLPQQDGSTYNLQPDAVIYSVSYLSLQEYKDYIELIKDRLHTWKDYGSYQQK